jgi:hypothetical protein
MTLFRPLINLWFVMPLATSARSFFLADDVTQIIKNYPQQESLRINTVTEIALSKRVTDLHQRL